MELKGMYFTTRQLELLNTEAKKLGISFSELVRRIVDQYLSGLDVT
jgi:hypothetical protein